MVNQQLKDYIDEQVRVGVSRDAIKSALLEAGWNFSEVTEAMGMGAAPATQVQQPVAPRMDAVKPQEVKPQPMQQARPVMQQPAARPVSQPAANRGLASASPVQASPMRDAQPVRTQPSPAQPAAQPRVMPVTDVKPMAKISSPSANVTSVSAVERPMRKGHRFVDLLMGFLILVLGFTAASFFVKNSNLSKALGFAQSDKETVVNESASLRTHNQTLQTENEALQQDRDDLASQLGILVSTRTSGEEPVSVKGLLGVTGDKALYTLRTSAGLLVTLKNSRDPAVEPALKQFLGTSISVTGTHQVGSKDIIVMMVNGAEVVAPAASASSTASSTTR